MKMRSDKIQSFKGIVEIPGDKSISHRSVMFGGIAYGTTRITGLLEGEDVHATIGAMRAMGAKIWKEGGVWFVEGVGEKGLSAPAMPLDMGNSGTSTRLLAGVVAGYPIRADMMGDGSLSTRPMKRVTEPLSKMGAKFSCASGGTLPMHVYGTDKLKPIRYTLPVASAQVKSALLLAALRAEGETVIVEPTPTRDHTETMLQAFGVSLMRERTDKGVEIRLKGRQFLRACDIVVPADPSSAAFVIVAALITPDSDVLVPNVMLNPTRAGLVKVLRDMEGDIEILNERYVGGEKVADLRVRSSALKGMNVAASIAPSMIDEYPVLAVAAACATGTTSMYGLEELRVKESDRLALMVQGLRACGVKVEEGRDYMVVTGTGQPPKGGAEIKTRLDHRIAMAFMVLGMVTQEPVMVDDGTPIQTSFPTFTSLMNNLGATIRTV